MVLQGADAKSFERKGGERRVHADKPRVEPLAPAVLRGIRDIQNDELRDKVAHARRLHADGEELDHFMRHGRPRRAHRRLNLAAIYRRARRRIAACDGDRACVVKVRQAVRDLVAGKFVVSSAKVEIRQQRKRLVSLIKRMVSRCGGADRACAKRVAKRARAVIFRRLRSEMALCNGSKSCIKSIRKAGRRSLRKLRAAIRALARDRSSVAMSSHADADFDEDTLLQEAQEEKASCDGDAQCISGVHEALVAMIHAKIEHIEVEVEQCADAECTVRLEKRIASLKRCLVQSAQN